MTDARWVAPTPCTDWSVHDLARHVVAGNELAVAVLAGRSPAAPGPLPSDSVLAAFRRTAREQRAAFGRTDPDVLVDHPAARVRAGDLTIYRCADVAVHAWDLARALGRDDAIGPALVEEVLVPYVRWVQTLDDAVVGGMYAPRADLGATPSPQDRLLAQLGRTP